MSISTIASISSIAIAGSSASSRTDAKLRHELAHLIDGEVPVAEQLPALSYLLRRLLGDRADHAGPEAAPEIRTTPGAVSTQPYCFDIASRISNSRFASACGMAILCGAPVL